MSKEGFSFCHRLLLRLIVALNEAGWGRLTDLLLLLRLPPPPLLMLLLFLP